MLLEIQEYENMLVNLFSEIWTVVDVSVDWIEKNPGVASVVATILGFVGLALVGFLFRMLRSVGGMFIGAVNALFRRVRDRLKVELVTSSSDRLMENFLNLYQELFEEDSRTASSEIIDWVDGKGNQFGIEYKAYVATVGSAAIGIGIAMADPQKRMIFVPYMGLSDEANKWGMSEKVIKKFLKAISKTVNYKYIILELDHPSLCSRSEKEFQRRCARIRRFEAYCMKLGVPLYFSNFEYLRPSYHTDADDKGMEKMVLGVICRPNRNFWFSREEVMGILNFLYLNIYNNCLWREASTQLSDASSIADQLNNYAQNLPVVSRFKSRFEIQIEE